MAAASNIWFSRYPCPQYIGYDGGSEFKSVFKHLVRNYDHKKGETAIYNPQANGVHERVYQVLDDA